MWDSETGMFTKVVTIAVCIIFLLLFIWLGMASGPSNYTGDQYEDPHATYGD